MNKINETSLPLETAPKKEEPRTFVQKPWVMPNALRDQLKRCEEAREIKSKGSASDAYELSEMDKNKLRMMGAGN